MVILRKNLSNLLYFIWSLIILISSFYFCYCLVKTINNFFTDTGALSWFIFSRTYAHIVCQLIISTTIITDYYIEIVVHFEVLTRDMSVEDEGAGGETPSSVRDTQFTTDSSDLADWMGRLPDRLLDLPLNRLAIPGENCCIPWLMTYWHVVEGVA